MVFFNPSLAQKLAVTLTKKQNASGVKKSRSQVHKYLYEGALPRRDAMLQIFDITDLSTVIRTECHAQFCSSSYFTGGQ
jgi:hypothetical protein